jgi:NAD(P)-dependent dehydrogenase (short-subunit alcohol dehydrogenase family)
MTDDAPLAGRTALVTGSTGGIGTEIARGLAARGATVLLDGRDREAGERVRESLRDPATGDHALYTADLSEMAAVRDLAAAVRDDHDRLDVLVHNAGTWQGDHRLVAVPGADGGVEFTFAVNHLAPYLLTHCLFEAVAASDADPARIVTVSSEVHRRGAMDLDAVRGPDGPAGVDAYGLSKLANVMFTYELARRLPEGVVANACHPGVSPATDLSRDGSTLAGLGWRLYGLVGGVLGTTDSPAEAAETPLYLASAPEAAELNGEYVDDREPVRSSEASYDRAAQRDLWAASAEMVALTDEERAPLST